MSRALGRRKAEKFLRAWAEIANADQQIESLLPTRPKSQRDAQAKARDEGAAWLRAVLPHLIASLPPE